MKGSTLKALCCPDCQGPLSLGDEAIPDVIKEGDLSCLNCGRNFPIENGIVQFIREQELEGLNLRLSRFYKRYSRIEPFLDKLSFLSMGGERKARNEVLGRLELSGGRILEVSIGSGANLRHLFEFSGVESIFGLDISAAQLVRCHRFVNKRGWPVELFLGMAEALPFKPESFDCVFHIGGINFFSDKKRAIDEMIRVARPGTKIVIADESERVAQVVARFLRLSRTNAGQKVDTSVPDHLVPRTMEALKVDGIWKRHGRYHGYCLEFRKPA